MSRKCINCGEELAQEDKYCPLCGTLNPAQPPKQNVNAKYEGQYNPYEAGQAHQLMKEKSTHKRAWLILTIGAICISAIYHIGVKRIEDKKANLPAAQLTVEAGEMGALIETKDFDFIIKDCTAVEAEKLASMIPEGKKIVAVKATVKNLKDEKIFDEYPTIYAIYDGDKYIEPMNDYEIIDLLERIGYNRIYLNDVKYDGSAMGYFFYAVDENVSEITLAYSELDINDLRGTTIGTTYEVKVPINE